MIQDDLWDFGLEACHNKRCLGLSCFQWVIWFECLFGIFVNRFLVWWDCWLFCAFLIRCCMSRCFGMIRDKISYIILEFVCPNNLVDRVTSSHLILKKFELKFLWIKLQSNLCIFSFINIILLIHSFIQEFIIHSIYCLVTNILCVLY